MGVLLKGKTSILLNFYIRGWILDILTNMKGGIGSIDTLERIAGGDRNAVMECSVIHGPLIWAWAQKFTDSTDAAESAALQILNDIRDSAKGFDAAKCSEVTFIKRICIRRLIGVAAR